MEPTVESIMNREVVKVTPTSPLRDAVRKMNEMRIGCLVVESKGSVVGILTERDILRLVENGRSLHDLTVNTIMTSPIAVVGRDEKIQDACNLMLEQRIRRLPIINDGLLVGIITSTDIIRAAKDGLFVGENTHLSKFLKENRVRASSNLSSPEDKVKLERPVAL